MKAILRQLVDELIAFYASDDRGVEIREIAGGYRMATKPECHDAVRMFIKSLKPAMKLSLPALETLAVIAYKQPVTAPEVNEIRGVDSSGVFGSLLARKLITTAGRKQVIGRPILYKTTKEFLLRFGLKDVSELPSMDEFEKMAALSWKRTIREGGWRIQRPAMRPRAVADPNWTRTHRKSLTIRRGVSGRKRKRTSRAEPNTEPANPVPIRTSRACRASLSKAGRTEMFPHDRRIAARCRPPDEESPETDEATETVAAATSPRTKTQSKSPRPQVRRQEDEPKRT